jgi:hypothetical protein
LKRLIWKSLKLERRMDKEQVETVEQEEAEPEVTEVDLNQVFPEDGTDLNSMFPDSEMKDFLRQVKKNQRSNKRFLEGFQKEKLWEEDE